MGRIFLPLANAVPSPRARCRGSFGQAMASILQFLASVLAPAASLSLGTGRVFAGSMFLLAAVFAAMAALPSHATAHWSPQGAGAREPMRRWAGKRSPIRVR